MHRLFDHKTIITVLLNALVITYAFTGNAQLTTADIHKMDSLFLGWNSDNHPGGSVAVMQADQVLLKRAYGLASLEYQVPNTPETRFNIGSVSKQFTAMGIILLEEQRLLSIDDDIRNYLPEIPDFGHTITIRHLIHHTSGLRSLHALFGIAGWRGDDSRTNEDLNRILKDQQDLNFKPGDEFLYCNTGYMLMSTIIERITKEPFTDWMKKSVFEPLQMHDTYVEDMYQRIVPQNATSYYSGEELLQAVPCWGYVGSGNVHSTSEDLLNWFANFYQPSPGWESAFEKMKRTKALNDGTPNSYAFGLTLDQDLGRDRIQHGGSIGGFRAFGCVYPEEETSIVVLTNFSKGNPAYYARRLAEILWTDKTKEAETEEAPKTVRLSRKALGKFEGSYWYPTSKIMRKIYWRNDTLRYYRSENNENALIPVAKNRFKMRISVNRVFLEFKEDNGLMELVFEEPGSVTVKATRVEVKEASLNELNSYSGVYRSLELETLYTIKVEGDEVEAYNIRHGSIELGRITRDKFRSTSAPITFEFNRDDTGNVIEMYISNRRARNVKFHKLE